MKLSVYTYTYFFHFDCFSDFHSSPGFGQSVGVENFTFFTYKESRENYTVSFQTLAYQISVKIRDFFSQFYIENQIFLLLSFCNPNYIDYGVLVTVVCDRSC